MRLGLGLVRECFVLGLAGVCALDFGPRHNTSAHRYLDSWCAEAFHYAASAKITQGTSWLWMQGVTIVVSRCVAFGRRHHPDGGAKRFARAQLDCGRCFGCSFLFRLFEHGSHQGM